jgi:hypothetical protein
MLNIFVKYNVSMPFLGLWEPNFATDKLARHAGFFICVNVICPPATKK